MPTEVAVGPNNLPFLYSQPSLFQYGSNIYTCAGDEFAAFFGMFKSTDYGNTWAQTASVSLGAAVGSAQFGTVLIGTRLYVWYCTVGGSGKTTSLGYYDFTTDTFNTVATTGTTTLPNAAKTMLMTGPDAAHLYTIADQIGSTFSSIEVNAYISGVATSVGTVVDTSLSSGNIQLQAITLGASGIIHVLYVIDSGAGPTVHLRYFNINAGVLSTPVTVNSAFSDGFMANGTFASPVQIGSNIYFAFYLPSASQVKMCSFSDVASPAFSFSTIDPSWAITPTSGYATGQNITALYSLFGAALICFYTNTNIYVPSSSTVGDGWLYCRTSTDLGVTWSPLQQIIQHHSPGTGAVIPIVCPCALNSIDNTFPFNPLFASYLQNQYPFVSTGETYLMFVPVCPSPTPPPPVISGGWESHIGL